MSLASELDDVLVWVNETRQAYNLPTLAELPKGKPGNSSCCVIARGLSGRAYGNEGYVASGPNEFLMDEDHRVYFPEFVAEFVAEFDAHAYPELIEETA